VAWTPPYLTERENIAEAEAFLAEFHPDSTVPVPIDEIAEWDFEKEIIPLPGVKDTISVDAFLTSDRRSIYVDEYVLRFVPTRYRFSLAHELGHEWLHAELYESTKLESLKDWRALIRDMDEAMYRRLEFQANMFAGLVLVPPDRLSARFTRRVEEARQLGLERVAITRHPARQRFIDGLASEFVVSEEAMGIRLEADGHLPPLIQR
jgi:hypothetical protein